MHLSCGGQLLGNRRLFRRFDTLSGRSFTTTFGRSSDRARYAGAVELPDGTIRHGLLDDVPVSTGVICIDELAGRGIWQGHAR